MMTIKSTPRAGPGVCQAAKAPPVSADGGLDRLEMLLLRNRVVEFPK